MSIEKYKAYYINELMINVHSYAKMRKNTPASVKLLIIKLFVTKIHVLMLLPSNFSSHLRKPTTYVLNMQQSSIPNN